MGLNSDNACYHPVQNVLSYHLLLKSVKIKIYRTIYEEWQLKKVLIF
jgi:hypothetical protein